VGVSVADHLDAAQALSRISLWDRDVVRAALLSTLIKRADHVDTFNLLFELVTGEPREPGADLVSALSDEQLQTMLRQVAGSGEEHLLRLRRRIRPPVRRAGAGQAGRRGIRDHRRHAGSRPGRHPRRLARVRRASSYG